MININTKFYGTGNFQFRKQALITCRAPFDCTYETSVKNFEIGGTEPEGTSRRIIFKIEDELYRFVNGILDKYIWRGELEDILQYGNTVAELLALENVNAFISKKVYPIIALDAPANADVFPKIKIALKVSSYNDDYTRYFYSPLFELAENAQITKVKKLAVTSGNGSEMTECRLKKITGLWSDWQNYILAENQIAQAIQFRTKFVVSTLDGTDSAQIQVIDVEYTTDADKNAADSQNFFTKIENYDADLHTCYLLVKHQPADAANIRAFVSLNPAREKIEDYEIGVTTGELQTFTLPKSFMVQDTLRVEVDGVPIFDYEFDTGAATLTLTADAGKVVSVSYDYLTAENWQEMHCDFSEDYRTRFTFRSTNLNLREAAVNFRTDKQIAAAIEMELGTGTGKKQTFVLAGEPQNFLCNVPYKLHGRTLETLAPIGEIISVRYGTKGTLPKIEGYIAGFAV